MRDPRHTQGAAPARQDSPGRRGPRTLAAAMAALFLAGLLVPGAGPVPAQEMAPPPAETAPDEPGPAEPPAEEPGAPPPDEPGPPMAPPDEPGPPMLPPDEPGPPMLPPDEPGPPMLPPDEPPPAEPPADQPRGPETPQGQPNAAEPRQPAPGEPREPAPGEPREPAPGEPREPAPGEPREPAPESTAPRPEEPDATRPQEVEVLPSPDAPILLNFKDASVHAVLEHLSEVAGLVVIEEAKVDGRVTVMSRQPVTVEEAVALLDTILKEKGYAAVRTGRTLKIVTLAQAAKESIPVHSGGDPVAIPVADRMITQVIPIRFADAVKLKADLAPLLPSHATLSANAASNALVLVDTQSNVRRIVEIIQALDQHMASVAEVKVFQLKYADATNTARLITEMFKRDQNETAQSARRMFPFPFGREGRGGGGDQQDAAGGGRQQNVVASADSRTNTVVVTAPPDLLVVIEDLIKQLDSNPSEEQAVFIYPLKNAQAVNLESILNNLFGWSTGSSRSTTTSRLGQTGGAFGSSGRTTGGASSSRFGSSGAGTSRFGSSGLGSSGAGTSRFGSSGQSAFGGTSVRPSAGTVAAASDLAGQAYVVADTDTNSLLVTTASKNFERVQGILADLDRPVPQVLIKVLIAEVTHENTLDLGVEFSILNLRSTGNGTVIGTDFAVAGQTGGLTFRLTETDVTAAVRAIAGTAKLDVLSRPYVLTSDNQEATIMVGQEVPFIRNTRLTETGQTINTIEYEDIGIIVSVLPHINPDGLVIMDVYPEISTITGTTVPISETVSAPVFAKRSAQTRIAVPDGQTIVIGGLMEDRVTDTVEKVPIVGDIPLLGLLFQRKIQAKTKTELLVFLTPHVATKPEDLDSMSRDEQAGMKVTPQAVEEGAFQEHMQGLQRGSAARRAAEEAEAQATPPVPPAEPPAARTQPPAVAPAPPAPPPAEPRRRSPPQAGVQREPRP